MDKFSVGDTVEVTSGWFRGKTLRGKIIETNEDSALVYGGRSLGTYRYEKMTLISSASEKETRLADIVREFIQQASELL